LAIISLTSWLMPNAVGAVYLGPETIVYIKRTLFKFILTVLS